MLVSAEIREKLDARFSPRELEVIDESEQHIGHAGYQEGGQSHFRVRMRAEELDGLSRVARHRAVHDALGPDLIGRIHALALDLAA
ncbi:BolA family protein [Pseudooceanicola onchidii]|uniref:BolA family protein n=1 Tax=Pseudooceanicola onchidii TaxID=2562279 RepID=UPI0010AA01F9|nr:BolA family protein [Pseudooceanicola onchidii]